MFTGLVAELGTVTKLKPLKQSYNITVKAQKVLESLKIGDSIAINGACQTVIKIGSGWFEVFSSYETLKLTTLNSLKTGSIVNLERALRLSDRLGGHIVSGHVDAQAALIAKRHDGEAV